MLSGRTVLSTKPIFITFVEDELEANALVSDNNTFAQLEFQLQGPSTSSEVHDESVECCSDPADSDYNPEADVSSEPENDVDVASESLQLQEEDGRNTSGDNSDQNVGVRYMLLL